MLTCVFLRVVEGKVVSLLFYPKMGRMYRGEMAIRAETRHPSPKRWPEMSGRAAFRLKSQLRGEPGSRKGSHSGFPGKSSSTDSLIQCRGSAHRCPTLLHHSYDASTYSDQKHKDHEERPDEILWVLRWTAEILNNNREKQDQRQ